MRANLVWTSTMSLLIGMVGCGGGGEQPERTANRARTQGPQSASETLGDKPAADGTDNGAGRNTIAPRMPSDVPAAAIDVSYITEDFVAAVVLQPRRLVESPLYRELANVPGFHPRHALEQLTGSVGIEPAEIEQIVVLIDRNTANAASQLPTRAQELNQTEKLWRIGRALADYHDAHGYFPSVDSGPDGTRGLSWRVHILPYLGERALYDSFRLGEPWDSEHNQQLIGRMPDVYVPTHDVAEGKTCLQVFADREAPLAGEQPRAFRDLTDERTRTILVVEAGPEAAGEWTRPGGLEFHPENPKEPLGTLPDDGFLALFADFTIRRLRSDIPDHLLKQLITHRGNDVSTEEELSAFVTTGVDFKLATNLERGKPAAEPPRPSGILRFNRNIDPQKLIDEAWTTNVFSINTQGEVIEERLSPRMMVHAGRTYYVAENRIALHFPDHRTLVIGPEESLRRMLVAQSVDSPLVNGLRQIGAGSDLIVALDLSSTRDHLTRAAAQLTDPIESIFAGVARLTSKLRFLTLTANISGDPQSNLVRLVLAADDAEAARQLEQVVGGLLSAGRQAYQEWRQNDPRGVPASAQALLPLADSLVSGISSKATGDEFALTIVKPEGFSRLPELLKPIIEEDQKRSARRARVKNLHIIGLGMHNYHDVYGHFPNADRGPRSDDANRGLGWRMYLAPYIDFGSVYSQMKLDEPWDSEHNRPLVVQIPDAYVTTAAREAGHTTIHVFVGEGAPFGRNEPLRIEQITDGASLTILAVEAGPETSVEWTRPGGLTFDPDNPKKALGTLPNDGLPVLFFDGRAVLLSKDVPDDLLKALITPDGGEPVTFEDVEAYRVRQ